MRTEAQRRAGARLRLAANETREFGKDAAVRSFKEIGAILNIHPESARRDYRNAIWKLRRYAKTLLTEP